MSAGSAAEPGVTAAATPQAAPVHTTVDPVAGPPVAPVTIWVDITWSLSQSTARFADPKGR